MRFSLVALFATTVFTSNLVAQTGNSATAAATNSPEQQVKAAMQSIVGSMKALTNDLGQFMKKWNLPLAYGQATSQLHGHG